MINIAVCDDEISMTTAIEEELYRNAKANGIHISVDVFFDGSTLENYIKTGHQFDIIYLDIEMKIKNGIDSAKEIRKIDSTVLLIYVSGYDSYIRDLFEVEPFRFISKPINRGIFSDYFKKACERVENKEQYFLYHFNKDVKKIFLKDILYFESQKRVIHIHTLYGVEKFYGKLNDIEKALQKNANSFVRIHQSFLVNYDYIARINFSRVYLSDGIELQISEDRQKEVRKQLCVLTGGDL